MSSDKSSFETTTPTTGMISWFDLTVAEAERARDFYSEVCGWSFEPHEMGGYHDYEMKMPQNGETIAGICHRRGPNDHLPPVWLPYIVVEDLDQSLAKCLEKGGKVCGSPRWMGSTRYILIEDPFGAFFVICACETAAGSGDDARSGE